MKKYILGLLTGLVLGLCALTGHAQILILTNLPTPNPQYNITLSPADCFALGQQLGQQVMTPTNAIGSNYFSQTFMIGGLTNPGCEFRRAFHQSIPNQTTNFTAVTGFWMIIPQPN